MNKIILKLDGLTCASCGSDIENYTNKLKEVSKANLNFVNSKLEINLKDYSKKEKVIKTIEKQMKKLEPSVDVQILNNDENLNDETIELELAGLDCSSCAEEIQDYSMHLEGVKYINFNFVTKKLIINLEDGYKREDIIEKIKSKIKIIEPNVDVIEVKNKNMTNKLSLELEGLDCSSCAEDIKEYALKLKGVSSADINFIDKVLNLELIDLSLKNMIIEKIKEKMKKLEPSVIVREINNSKKTLEKTNNIRLELNGLNCTSCANEIVLYTKQMSSVEDVNLNFVNKIMELRINDIDKRDVVIENIKNKLKLIEPDVVVIDKSFILDNDKNIKDDKKESITKKSIDNDLLKIALSTIFFILPYVFGLEGRTKVISFLISYLIVGLEIIEIAIRNIIDKNPMDEHFLMTVATMGAFIIGEYPEGIAVMLLYQIGEYFQGKAVNHSRKSIKGLMDIVPEYANLVQENDIISVDPYQVSIGDHIIVRPGEKVPLDGVVIDGSSTLDTSNITGESIPQKVNIGDDIVSGVVNKNGALRVKVNKEYNESTITKILDLVENASSKKAPTENFITKFSRYYTPIVVYIALGLALIPPLFFNKVLSDWAYRAFVFLVISCPCALVISIPLGYFGGIGAASKEGILIKGGNYLEALNYLDTIVLDKTGTITKGTFTVTEIKSYNGYNNDDILKIAAHGESFSNHPIGLSIVDYYNKEIDTNLLDNYEEIPGKGVKVEYNNKELLLGNRSLLSKENIDLKETASIGTVVYVGYDNKHIGTIVVSDQLKENIEDTIIEFYESGIKDVIMLSGDNFKTVKEVAELTGINEYYGDLLPQDKVQKFESIIKDKRSKNSKVAFVGDGVNDAPVLARADIGIAMGGLGSDAAIEASDIVIMTDEIHKIKTALNIAKKTQRIVIQNITLALGVKLIVLFLGAFGKASMWQAVFADVGVSIIAIFNSIRALKVED